MDTDAIANFYATDVTAHDIATESAIKPFLIAEIMLDTIDFIGFFLLPPAIVIAIA